MKQDKINKSFISSVLKLYDEFENQGISLVYIGKFNHIITKMFTAMSQEEMELNQDSKSVRRKLHHSVIEILQNMTKHSTRLFTTVKFGKGIFMLGRTDKAYYIMTANRIHKEDIANLETAILEVNEASPEELRKKYKAQLTGGKISDRGGAGLGLIDIVRKTGNKLNYLFLPIDDNHEYFVLKIKIDI